VEMQCYALFGIARCIRQHQVIGTVFLEVFRQVYPVVGAMRLTGEHIQLVVLCCIAGQPLLDKVMPDHAVADHQQTRLLALLQRCRLLLYTSHTAPRVQKKRRPLSASHQAKGKRTPLSVKSNCHAAINAGACYVLLARSLAANVPTSQQFDERRFFNKLSPRAPTQGRQGLRHTSAGTTDVHRWRAHQDLFSRPDMLITLSATWVNDTLFFIAVCCRVRQASSSLMPRCFIRMPLARSINLRSASAWRACSSSSLIRRKCSA